MCQGHPVLPIGMSDIPRRDTVKVFCPQCHDVYRPRLHMHTSLDGAFFGTTFAHMFMLHYKMQMRSPPVTIHRNPYYNSSMEHPIDAKDLEKDQQNTSSQS